MKNKFTHFRKTFAEFSETPYIREFHVRFVLTLSLLLLFLLCLCLRPSFAPGIVLLFTFLLYIGFLILYWRDYYRTVITTAAKMEHIKNRYSLINAKDMIDYPSALHIILDLVNSNLEHEYSNQLLQQQIEFDAMKNQINPHFLYNTLDTIRGYAMMESAPITSDMIEVLSRLFRYSLSQKNNIIPLCQELSVLSDYIKIQKYRMNRQIDLIEDIDSDLEVMDYQIPKLTIQPFIENAINHGLKDITRDFRIILHIFRTQSRLIISISDNGIGMSPEQLSQLNQRLAQTKSSSPFESNLPVKGKGTGIALVNVNARIKLIYGKEYGIIAYSTLGKGSEFQISLPYSSDSSKGRKIV